MTRSGNRAIIHPLRILFSCVAGDGHFHPLVPLAGAFAASGHDVAFATAPTYETRVRGAGFSFLPAGLDLGERQALFAPYRAEQLALPYTERRAVLFPRLFGTIEAPAKIERLRAAVEAWQPELLVHDSADLAAPVAAAERGIPSVHHSFGRAVPRALVAKAAAQAGLTPEPYGGMFGGVYVDISPPSLRDADGVPPGTHVEPLRPIPMTAAPGEKPDWLDRLPGRPTVYLTLGTVHNDAGIIGVLFEGLAGVDCNVIATVGRNNDPDGFAPVPPNVRVERYIPQSLLLPHCDAVVNHAGSGSMLAALAYGLPMLLVPQAADQFDNAGACVSVGAAEQLLPDELHPDAARAAVERVLADPAYRERSRAVAAEIAAMPEPASVAVTLAGTDRC